MGRSTRRDGSGLVVNSQRFGRIASIGMALTLLALTALSLTGVYSTRAAADTVVRSSATADVYSRASKAVANEESLARKYRVERSDAVRAEHSLAGVALHNAFKAVSDVGGAEDKALIVRLRELHERYGYAILEVFAAVDSGSPELAAKINNERADRDFVDLINQIQRASDVQVSRAAAAVVDLRRVQSLVFAATVIGFAVGLSLVILFAIIMHGYQRALSRQSDINEHQSLHDVLTGLPNRALYTDRVSVALANYGRSGQVFGVMLLDLDRFKEVNDTLGHHFGDELLKQVADRLGEELREGDTVARLAGDEFAILVPGADATTATQIADRVLRSLHRSFVLDGVTVDVEASVGVALAPVHADTVEGLMRCADVAMYSAKDAKTGVVLFEAGVAEQQPSRLLMLGDLRRALEQPDELILYYQPKVNLPHGDLCGVEALVRWQHPTRGLVMPGEFLPVIENTGLINLLTTHVLRQAIAQVSVWLKQGLRVPVAVNLSARCLLDTTLLPRVRALLEEYGLPAELLRLEVTESAVMADPTLALATLTGLNNMGIRLSIDDYGTGYSSMGYLKRLPVDELKVDRSFVLNMTEDPGDAFLVRSAIDLGHNLGLTVVAEGVELADHVAALGELGCDIAQGFHYARPMPAEALLSWAQDRASVSVAG